MIDILLHELKFCLEHRENKGFCTFGGGTKCEQCAAPYLARKLISGEIIHGDIQRLTLEDWKEKIKQIEK